MLPLSARAGLLRFPEQSVHAGIAGSRIRKKPGCVLREFVAAYPRSGVCKSKNFNATFAEQ